MSGTPRTTAVVLCTVLALIADGLGAFVTERDPHAAAPAYLGLFGAVFALRVLAQIGVILFRARWLPPASEWNFLPYRLLLPLQACVLLLIGAIMARHVSPSHEAGRVLTILAFAYWGAMVVRYVQRMTRRPDQRWFGGAIPIVFHCVLAAFVFVLGASG